MFWYLVGRVLVSGWPCFGISQGSFPYLAGPLLVSHTPNIVVPGLTPDTSRKYLPLEEKRGEENRFDYLFVFLIRIVISPLPQNTFGPAVAGIPRARTCLAKTNRTELSSKIFRSIYDISM
jgi:hypothetical protein